VAAHCLLTRTWVSYAAQCLSERTCVSVADAIAGLAGWQVPGGTGCLHGSVAEVPWASLPPWQCRGRRCPPVLLPALACSVVTGAWARPRCRARLPARGEARPRWTRSPCEARGEATVVAVAGEATLAEFAGEARGEATLG